jgi:hypothetical protein
VIGIVEGMKRRAYSYSNPNSVIVGRDNSNGGV